MQKNISDTQSKRRALFGIRNPILKAIFLVAFVLITGGLGLVIILLAYGSDRLIKKSKT